MKDLNGKDIFSSTYLAYANLNMASSTDEVLMRFKYSLEYQFRFAW